MYKKYRWSNGHLIGMFFWKSPRMCHMASVNCLSCNSWLLSNLQIGKKRILQWSHPSLRKVRSFSKLIMVCVIMEPLLWPQVTYFICYGYWTPQFNPWASLSTKMASWEKCGLRHQRNAGTPQTCPCPATQLCQGHWMVLSLLPSLETEEVTADPYTRVKWAYGR